MSLRRHARAFVVLGAILIAASFVAPEGYDAAIYDLIGVISVAAMAAGIRRNNPMARRSWLFIASGVGFMVAGDVAYDLLRLAGHVPSGASLVDLLYLGGYPLLAVGLVGLARARSGGRDVDGLIDGAILAVAASFVIWQALLQPVLAEGGRPVDLVVALSYPVLDVVLLVVAVYLLISGDGRVPSYWFLVGGIGMTLAADVLYAAAAASTTAGPIAEAGFLGSYVLLGAAVLHPSMTRLSEPAKTAGLRVGRSRGLLLGAAVLTGPSLRLLNHLRGDDTDAWLLIGASATVALLVIGRIVTLVGEVERANQQARVQDARFRSLVQNTSDIIGIIEFSGAIRYLSPSVERVLGWRPEELIGTAATELIHPDDLPDLVEALVRLAEEPGNTCDHVYRTCHRDGSWYWMDARFTNLIDDPTVGGIVVNERDVTEQRAVSDALRHQALHDALTGLPNRTLFLDRLELALARSERRGTSVAVLFADLDHFKVVNDSLGHEAGDRLLVGVAARLATLMRPGDTIARFGGDEFTLLCEDVTDADDAVQLARRLIAAMASPFDVDGIEVHVCASIGITLAQGRSALPDAIVRDADSAMYRAKETGRGRCEVFDSTMRERALARLHTETALRKAMGDGDLLLYYQPVVEMATGRRTGVEALVRWARDDNELVLPSEFISIAEETGLINELGEWVLEEGCRQLARWDEQPGTRGLSLAVNLSARQLVVADLRSVVEGALSAAGIAPGRLCLEITESALMVDVDVSITALRALKDLGVLLAVDDFGTGYSSLTYLKRLPIDVLKIDRSFVAGLGGTPEDAAIVQAVVKLAQNLGLEAVAEGVETAHQVGVLSALGCDYAQGYFYGRPAPAAELVATDATWESINRRAMLIGGGTVGSASAANH